MKALLITYHFPPSLGGCPMRTGAFAEFLADRGWECHVVAADIPADHPVYKLDAELAQSVHDRIRVYPVSEGFPGRVAQFLRRRRDEAVSSRPTTAARKTSSSWTDHLKSAVFPDPKVGWIPGAIYRARQLAAKRRFDLLYSFGYPWSCHLAAWAVRKTARIPWIADYGDPWTLNPETSHYPRWRRRLDFMVESRLSNDASAVVVSTPETRAAFVSSFGSALSCKTYVAPVAQFHAEEYDATPLELPEQFQLSFTGMYNATRQPFSFYDAARVLRERNDVRICVAGLIGKEYEEYAYGQGLRPVVLHLGRLNRRQTVQLQRNSHVLLSFGWAGGVQVPCKIYEYFAARRPILHISGDSDDPAASLVRRYHRGVVVPNDARAIEEALRTMHQHWTSGTLDAQFDLSPLAEFCLPRSLDGLQQAVEAVVPTECRSGAASFSDSLAILRS